VVLARLSAHGDKLVCPRCSSAIVHDGGGYRCVASRCPSSARPFPAIKDAPVLLDFEKTIVSFQQLLATAGSSQVVRPTIESTARRRATSLVHPRNRQAQRNVARMFDLLRRDHRAPGHRPLVLVVGGASVGDGLEHLYNVPDIEILAFDIYWSHNIQFIGDGHSIPLADESIDGVIVQAVLEHVLEPQVVVAEIHRVLKHGGLIYADTPFLQHVHEGAYDFARFTDSGHRYLLRNFERIDSGAVAGAGTQLAWSIDYFFRALTRSRRLGTLVKLAFFWLSYVDRFLDAQYSLDAASSVYFLGRRSESPISAADIVTYYQGAQRTDEFRSQ
jgi:SAM-dependent methyltransferase